MKPTKGYTIISLSNVELQRIKSLCCTKRSVGGGHRDLISSKLQRRPQPEQEEFYFERLILQIS